MAIQFPRGTGSANSTFTGKDGTFSIDFTNEEIIVHDGTTEGGKFSVNKSSDGVDASTDLSVTYTESATTVVNSGGANATIAAATTSNSGVMASSDKKKLNDIAANATKNQTDSDLLNRSNHTGSQAASTITGLDAAVVSAVENNDIDFGTL